MRLEGTFTALITPFRGDGSIDLDELSTLVEWQIESGIDGLVPCGSTGESATLTPAEHVQVVRHVIQVANGRVPVIAGTGSNNTREAVEFTAEAKAAGANAALLISPYYNKPPQDGIYRHYRTIAEETGIPLIVYNIPGRTSSRISPETLGRLSRVDGIIGLKESGGDLVLAAEAVARADADFSIVSGDDALTLPLLSIGGKGVISVASNIAPIEMAQITTAFLANDPVAARDAHYRLLPVIQALFIESNPIPVKAALQILGRIAHATVRLPLTEMQKEHRDQLEAVLDGIPRA
ncbi:MAG: 4-hydroxy-tetrahydrodipicolinate synthase [bacterium]|nr:4-hydroxy-tetrahydrodipicolinate synthase [bacterium]